MQENFTHLQLHTEYSLFEGIIRIKDLAKNIKRNKMNAVAITNYGNMFGAIEFYNTMRNEGIKPIIGIEILVYDKSINRTNLVCLYAKDYTGYKNLIHLTSMSYLKKFKKYPKIDKELLFKKSKNLICIDTYFQDCKQNLQKDQALEYKRIFGDDFYIGIIKYNNKHIPKTLIKLSKKFNIKIVALNNTSYLKQEDENICKIFSDIATFKLKKSPYLKKGSHLKTLEEMTKLYVDIPEAINNTQEIVNKCNLKLKFNNIILPNYKFTTIVAKEKNIIIPKVNKKYSFANDMALFKHLCKEGLKERLKYVPKVKHKLYWDRLDYEINIIQDMKFVGYMLIAWDYINYAKTKNIAVGYGRESVAGSLVSYALKITDINPIVYELLFESFINSQTRKPEIVIDFCHDGKHKIIDYLIKKYGKNNVAKYITFGTISSKNLIIDISRILDIPYAQVDKIVNLIPDNFYITLKEAYRENQKIKKELQCNPKLKTLWNYGIKLEGLKTSIGTSLAGVVINNKPLWKKVPLYKLNRQEMVAIQYTTQNIQDVGLTVFNFLGLKDLTIINKINELIEKKRGKKINFYEIDLNDSKVYKLISSGDTFGIFQLKSSFMQDILTRVKPTKFEDLSAILALSFPKPIENGTLNDFIDKKQNKVKINYFFDEFEQPLKPILGLTYGVIVYQEQIMKILQIIGGFNLDKADLARQAMSKQNKKQIDNFKDEFGKGGVKKGYSKKYCNKLFDSITKSAEFVNLKSHSISYAMISYQMAYLKTYYPNEFRSGIVINANEKY